MSSTSIYIPTYLYIKQHSITGMLYFGKTTKNPEKYLGSGDYWLRHIKKHGKEHVVNLWYCLFLDETDITEFALSFSHDNNIVESTAWANLMPENGTTGNIAGCKQPNISAALTGRPSTRKGIPTGKKGISCNKGRIPWNKGLTKDDPRVAKNAEGCSKTKLEIAKEPWNSGRKQPIVTCPHCGKTGGEISMKQWHFEKCENFTTTQST